MIEHEVNESAASGDPASDRRAFGLHEDDLRGARRLCHHPTESRKYSNADDETAMASILDKTPLATRAIATRAA